MKYTIFDSLTKASGRDSNFGNYYVTTSHQAKEQTFRLGSKSFSSPVRPFLLSSTVLLLYRGPDSSHLPQAYDKDLADVPAVPRMLNGAQEQIGKLPYLDPFFPTTHFLFVNKLFINFNFRLLHKQKHSSHDYRQWRNKNSNARLQPQLVLS